MSAAEAKKKQDGDSLRMESLDSLSYGEDDWVYGTCDCGRHAKTCKKIPTVCFCI